MPARFKRNRRRRSAHVAPEAVALFRRGFDLLHGPHDQHELRDLRFALAAELGRSKFSACPLDRQPRSLISYDTEPAEVVLGLQARLLKEIGQERL